MISKRSRYGLGIKREKLSRDPQFGFNAMMGAGSVQQTASKFKNQQSSNSIRYYNPFRQVLDDTGADDY